MTHNSPYRNRTNRHSGDFAIVPVIIVIILRPRSPSRWRWWMVSPLIGLRRLLPALRPSCSALLAGLDIFIRVLLPLRLVLRGA